jgi:hypothetical protein
MNTVARPVHTAFERRYFVAAAIGIIFVVLIGFSVDLPLLPHLGSLSLLVQVHGIVMLTWIALFFTQALLVARHRVDLHMRLGIFGAALAVALLVVDSATLIVACRLGGHHMPPGVSPERFFALGFFNLATFAILICSAILLRKHSAWHKRLMLLAALLLLDAALARFINAYTSWTVDPSTIRDLLIFACIAVDTWRHRRLHAAFVAGGLLVFANDYLANWAAATTAWLHFTKLLLT